MKDLASRRVKGMSLSLSLVCVSSVSRLNVNVNVNVNYPYGEGGAVREGCGRRPLAAGAPAVPALQERRPWGCGQRWKPTTPQAAEAARMAAAIVPKVQSAHSPFSFSGPIH